MTQLDKLLEPVLEIARRAGDAIMTVYGTEFAVDIKEDRSPLTEADRQAHDIICDSLADLDPSFPILSEESPQNAFDQRKDWSEYWLVDPLDGTKEFVKRNGEFTVNIALIVGGRPVLGVVRAPALDHNYFGAEGCGAWKQNGDEPAEAIKVTERALTPLRIVGSRSHGGTALDAILPKLGEHKMIPMGSSMKICLVAAGDADLYPRLGPTSEWDTAAAHAVLESAGGRMIDLDGHSLTYNKDDILNPFFLAFGDETRDWQTFFKD